MKTDGSNLERELGEAIVASGIGATVLGVLVVLADVSAGVKTALTWVGPVGALSGKTGVAVIAFVLSWVVLHFSLRGRSPKLDTMLIIGGVLLAVGILLTFPPVFEIFVDMFSGG
jgi:hypothetical protein